MLSQKNIFSMLEKTIVLLHFVFVLYLLYEYFSYLKWPRVVGVVKSPIDIKMGESLVRPKKEYRVFCYEFDFMGKRYKGSHQSRWLPFHFKPRYRIGENAVISVNKDDPRKSCFYRPILEFFITIVICLIVLFSAFLIWWFYIFMA